MSTSLVGTADGTESTFDMRWARWREAGAAQDRVLNRRAAIAATLAACAVAAWLIMSVALT
jgi:hypothetical protein